MTPNADIPLNSGRAMPVLGLGTWQLTDDTPLGRAATAGASGCGSISRCSVPRDS